MHRALISAVITSLIVGFVAGYIVKDSRGSTPRTDAPSIESQNVDMGAWKDYTSRTFGMTFMHPTDATITEDDTTLVVKNATFAITFTQDKTGSLPETLLKYFSPRVHQITKEDLWEATDIVIRYQTGQPETSAVHIIVRDYPSSPGDRGINKHILIADTSQDTEEKYQNTPLIVNSIIHSISFTN